VVVLIMSGWWTRTAPVGTVSPTGWMAFSNPHRGLPRPPVEKMPRSAKTGSPPYLVVACSENHC